VPLRLSRSKKGIRGSGMKTGSITAFLLSCSGSVVPGRCSGARCFAGAEFRRAAPALPPSRVVQACLSDSARLSDPPLAGP
jgi:hypothetical protein